MTTSIFLPTIAIFTTIAISTTMINKELGNVTDEKKIAKEIIKKKEDLKEYLSLSNLKTKNSFSQNSSEVATSNISRLIIPSLKYSNNEILILSKYQESIREHLKLNDPTNTPDCIQLSTGVTQRPITQSECEIATTTPFDFFQYNNGDIFFKVPNTIAPYIKEFQPTLIIVEEDINTTIFRDSFTVSKFTNDEIKKTAIKKRALQDKIELLVKNENYTAATKANIAMATLDRGLFDSNSENIIKTVSRQPVEKVSSETKKEIAKNISKSTELISIVHQQSNELNTTTIIQPTTTIQDFISLNLSTEEKEEIKQNTANRGVTQIDEIIKKRRESMLAQ